MQNTAEMFKEDSRKLGELLGIKTIVVKEVHDERPVKVTHYVKAINPFGEEVFVTEDHFRKCEELGLSMRRVS